MDNLDSDPVPSELDRSANGRGAGTGALVAAAGLFIVGMIVYSVVSDIVTAEGQVPVAPAAEAAHNHAAGESCESEPSAEGATVPLKPAGSKDAKVRLDAFLNGSNSCQTPNVQILTEVAKALPNRVRVNFHDTASPEGKNTALAAGVSCEAGLLVNDRKEIEVVQEGKKVTHSFHGPLTQTPPDVLETILIQEIERQYQGQVGAEELAKLKAVVAKAYQAYGGASAQGSGKAPPEPPKDTKELRESEARARAAREFLRTRP